MPPERSRVWRILFKVGLSPFKRIYFICLNESRSFIKRQTSGTSRDNEWQRVTTSGTTSDNEWQRVTTNDNEWQRVVQRMATSDNEWPFQLIFPFFQIREEPTTKQPKENSLNIEKDLWRRPTELRAETNL